MARPSESGSLPDLRSTSSPGQDNLALQLDGVTGGYVPGFDVIFGVGMGVPAGQVVLVIGPNGAGKSTVLQACLNRLPVRQGSVVLAGRDTDGAPPHQLVRQGMGYLPQGHSLFPGLSVADNLLMGLRLQASSHRRARVMLDQFRQQTPALRRLWHRRAGELSGGQQRLVEMARLRASQPTVALVDEPSAGVAPALCDDLYEELRQLAAGGVGILLVDQDIERALPVADTVVVMEQGRITLTGPRTEFAGRVREIVASWISASDQDGPSLAGAGQAHGGIVPAGSAGVGSTGANAAGASAAEGGDRARPG